MREVSTVASMYTKNDLLSYLRLERKSDSLIGKIADWLSEDVDSSPALVL